MSSCKRSFARLPFKSLVSQKECKEGGGIVIRQDEPRTHVFPIVESRTSGWRYWTAEVRGAISPFFVWAMLRAQRLYPPSKLLTVPFFWRYKK